MLIMKTLLRAVGVATLTLAAPLDRTTTEGSIALATRGASQPITEGIVTWTGSVAPGGSNITLQGNVTSISEQMKVLDPDLMAAANEVSDLIKRDVPVRNWPPAPCNSPAGGQVATNDCEGVLTALDKAESPGYSMTWTALPHENNPCNLVFCGNTDPQGYVGVYLCNDSNKPVTLSGHQIAQYLYPIFNTCGTSDEDTFTGQIFDPAGFNVIVKSCQGDPAASKAFH